MSQLNKYFICTLLCNLNVCLKMNFTNYFLLYCNLNLGQIFLALHPLFHYSLLRIIYLNLPIKSGSHHKQTNWAVYTF